MLLVILALAITTRNESSKKWIIVAEVITSSSSRPNEANVFICVRLYTIDVTGEMGGIMLEL